MTADCYTFIKDPLDKRKMTIDYSDWLDGAEIASTAWLVPTGIVEASDSFTASVAINYFSGGTLANEYEVACTITTDDAVPRLKTQRFMIAVEECC